MRELEEVVAALHTLDAEILREVNLPVRAGREHVLVLLDADQLEEPVAPYPLLSEHVGRPLGPWFGLPGRRRRPGESRQEQPGSESNEGLSHENYACFR